MGTYRMAGQTCKMAGEFSKAFEDLDFDEEEVADNVKCYIFYFLETVVLGGDKKRLVWGFETIPIVATIRPHGKYHGSSWIPKILEWSCPSILQYSKLTTSIFDRKDVSLPFTPLSAVPAVPVWNPFTLIDPVKRAALLAFIDDPSTTVHPGDYDALEKSLFELILANGAWLGDQEVDVALYYIRRTMINSPQMYDQRAIVIDCMFWEQSEHGEEDELSDTADWEEEQSLSPFPYIYQ
ncbi:hypothetical protein FNV43_RR21691 [Rhamnella rubrinervis]|uniref:Uncharacterized protein n=1 Tax=Rhamnella rubrinervis TaxID=2594499 RepID=A0A8K0GRD5_9ROSA|nr:hypothetical protein FNV43_RR21691 [Rhamnella rubrinervis]